MHFSLMKRKGNPSILALGRWGENEKKGTEEIMTENLRRKATWTSGCYKLALHLVSVVKHDFEIRVLRAIS